MSSTGIDANSGSSELEASEAPMCEPHPAFTEQQQMLLDTIGIDPWSLPEKSVERLAEGLRNAEAGMRLSNGDVMAQEAFKGRGLVNASLEVGDSSGGVDVSVTGEGYELRLSQSYATETGAGAYSLSFKDGDGAAVAVTGAGRASSAEASAVREYTDHVIERGRDPEVTARWEQEWMSAYKDKIEKQLREADLRSPSGEKLTVEEVYASSCADNVMARPRYQHEHEMASHARSPYDGRPMNVYDVRAKVTWTEKLPLPGMLPGLPTTTVDVPREAVIPVASVIPETGEPLDGHELVPGEPGLANEGLGPIEWIMDAIDGAGIAKLAVKIVVREFAEKGTKEALDRVPGLTDEVVEGLGRGGSGARTPDEVDDIVAGIVEAETIQPGHGSMPFRHARGYAGEQGMGFHYSQEKGWAFIEGPSGSGGHLPNQRGPDGVAFTTDGPLEIHILDNKSLKSDEPVKSATALTKNLEHNLETLSRRVNDPSMNDVPRIGEIRESIAAAREAVANGTALPANVRLRVTNSGSTHVTGINDALRDQGVEFRDIQTPQTAALSASLGQPPALASPDSDFMERHAAGGTAKTAQEPEGGSRTDQDLGNSEADAPPAAAAPAVATSTDQPETSESGFDMEREAAQKSVEMQQEAAPNTFSMEDDIKARQSEQSAGSESGFNMEEDAARQSADLEEEAEQGQFRMDLELFTELPDGADRAGEPEGRQFNELPDGAAPPQITTSEEASGTDGAEEGG